LNRNHSMAGRDTETENQLQTVESDVVVVGSGAAALTAALAAAAGGRQVTILEKSAWIGGTSAMSGGMTWAPANHHAAAAGVQDSPEEALAYMRAAAPAGWRLTEDALWENQVRNAGSAIAFIERHSPVRFTIAKVADPMMELEGAKSFGRLLSPRPLSRRILGPYAGRIRPSTLPQTLTYDESVASRLYRQPVIGTLRYLGTFLRRYLSNSRSKGNALITGLLKGCLDHGCQIELETRAVELLLDGSGSGVSGVIAEQRGQRRTFTARMGVVLATGGFEWDAKMLEKHFPAPVDYRSSPASNEGDGHRMAEAAGAKLDHMDQANIMVQPPVPYQGRMHGLPLRIHAEPDAIIVDSKAQRFASEYRFHMTETLMELDPATGEPRHLPAWIISHWPMVRRTPLIWWYRRYDRRWLIKARTLRELAEKVGLPPEALEATVERFNGFARSGEDADFHRGNSIYEKTLATSLSGLMRPINKPPYVAIRFQPSLLGTKGGVRTNARGQALRPDGSVIAGLYAAGNVMANPVGTRTPSQVGTTLGPYMTWGYICAQSILRDNRT
jgi:3-oxosteroid 1-dehydrogenase